MSEEIEQEIEQEIQDNIVEEHYFTGDSALDAVRFQWLLDDHRDQLERKCANDLLSSLCTSTLSGARHSIDVAMGRDGNGWNQNSLEKLVFCVLVLKNGFTVTGESACASPENFDIELGHKIARQNAINKVWSLMGYELKQRLFTMQHEAERI